MLGLGPAFVNVSVINLKAYFKVQNLVIKNPFRIQFGIQDISQETLIASLISVWLFELTDVP